MRSKCSSLLLSLAFIAFVPPAFAQPEDDGADMPPPPPRAKGREMQPGSWQRPESNNFDRPHGGGDNGPPGGFDRPRGGPEQGQFRRAGGGGGMNGMGGPIDLRPLNLSEEQRQKIQAMRNTTAENVRQVRTSLRSLRGQMKDMMFDPKATDTQIREKRREVRALQDKMDELLVNDFLKMRAVLTKEQLSHLPESKPQQRGPRGGFGDGGPGHMPQADRQFGDRQPGDVQGRRMPGRRMQSRMPADGPGDGPGDRPPGGGRFEPGEHEP